MEDENSVLLLEDRVYSSTVHESFGELHNKLKLKVFFLLKQFYYSFISLSL